jgi:formylglycine-generating enzyme required for sulfatase activity
MVLLAILLACSATVTEAVDIDWVTVGNPGNSADQDYGDGTFGSVGYTYRIGKTEVTNDQYAEFLNAIAASDPNGVWNSNMDITRSGIDLSYTYTPTATFGPNPLNYVSFINAMRFVNWLENGQPTGAQGAGTTETGTYTINNGLTETRAGGANFFLPNENEWYKAAYHQPSSAGGDADNYWLHATQSNTAPTAELPAGGANSANYNFVVNDTTDVGEYTGTTNFYGTYDQAGNVEEFNETLVTASDRGLRGGGWDDSSASVLAASSRYDVDPTDENDDYGFRVASLVPASAVAAITGNPVSGSLLDLGSVLEDGPALTGGSLDVENTGDATSTLTLEGFTGFANGFSLSSGDATAVLVGDGIDGTGDDIENFLFAFDPSGKASGVHQSVITLASGAGDLTYTLQATVSAVDTPSGVPEPSTTVLAAVGLIWFGFVGWRRRRRL